MKSIITNILPVTSAKAMAIRKVNRLIMQYIYIVVGL